MDVVMMDLFELYMVTHYWNIFAFGILVLFITFNHVEKKTLTICSRPFLDFITICHYKIAVNILLVKYRLM